MQSGYRLMQTSHGCKPLCILGDVVRGRARRLLYVLEVVVSGHTSKLF